MAKKKLTREAVTEARQLYREGWSYRELGERYGVDARTIAMAVKGLTWKKVPAPIPPPRRVISEEEAREIKGLREAGFGYWELAEKYGVGYHVIYQTVNRRELDRG